MAQQIRAHPYANGSSRLALSVTYSLVELHLSCGRRCSSPTEFRLQLRRRLRSARHRRLRRASERRSECQGLELPTAPLISYLPESGDLLPRPPNRRKQSRSDLHMRALLRHLLQLAAASPQRPFCRHQSIRASRSCRSTRRKRRRTSSSHPIPCSASTKITGTSPTRGIAPTSLTH